MDYYQISESLHSMLAHLSGGYGVMSYFEERRPIPDLNLAKKWNDKGQSFADILYRSDSFSDLNSMHQLLVIVKQEMKIYRELRDKLEESIANENKDLQVA